LRKSAGSSSQDHRFDRLAQLLVFDFIDLPCKLDDVVGALLGELLSPSLNVQFYEGF
jgi:hypothetical protein